ncbi:MAG TPA: hypothetical protein VF169_03270 [Albitalea sp.]|uniref:hypothetical protein n=1 Tax=Piscinibacter sp. TaxID=1903157 RepID=UPI002ED205BC
MPTPDPTPLLPIDGWVGTRELPGYRAGRIVVRLDHLPQVDAEHLYFDLLLLDPSGRTADNHSGPCHAMRCEPALEERSAFVRVVAELLRHAEDDFNGLTALRHALSYIREHGVGVGRLMAAAQLLDRACSEDSVIASLDHMLRLSVGESEAREVLVDAVQRQAGGQMSLDYGSLAHRAPAPPDSSEFEALALRPLVAYVVRTVGKTRARDYLRAVTDFELLPQPGMFEL